jgi:fructokinase
VPVALGLGFCRVKRKPLFVFIQNAAPITRLFVPIVTASAPAFASQITDARVVLLGEALIDHFPDTDVIGGAPFNVARNMAALGAAPVVITRIGEDADAATLLNEFSCFSLSQQGVQRDAVRATGNVRVTLDKGQPTFHIADNQAWDAIDPVQAHEVMTAVAPSIVCFGTLAQRNAVSRKAIRGVIEAASCLRVLDLNLRQCDDNRALSEWSLAHADIVKVNDDELAQLLAWFVRGAGTAPAWASVAHRQAVRSLIEKFAIKRLIVTRGANGYAAFGADGSMIAHGSAPKVMVVDTVGAGDAFLAACVLGELKGWTVGESLSRASVFAASVCTLRGAVSGDPAFYQSWRERFGLAAAATLAINQ